MRGQDGEGDAKKLSYIYFFKLYSLHTETCLDNGAEELEGRCSREIGAEGTWRELGNQGREVGAFVEEQVSLMLRLEEEGLWIIDRMLEGEGIMEGGAGECWRGGGDQGMRECNGGLSLI